MHTQQMNNAIVRELEDRIEALGHLPTLAEVEDLANSVSREMEWGDHTIVVTPDPETPGRFLVRSYPK